MSTSAKPSTFPVAITFTDSAARKVKDLIDEDGNSKLFLRVYVTGGGCSGFEYGFAFDETINPEEDYVVEKQLGSDEMVRLVIDSVSYGYLKDAEIDYREDLHGAQFIIRNPNAKTTCGCGSSFSVEEKEEIETEDENKD